MTVAVHPSVGPEWHRLDRVRPFRVLTIGSGRCRPHRGAHDVLEYQADIRPDEASGKAARLMVDRRGRLAFVPARFGPAIVGGAEIVLGTMALASDSRLGRGDPHHQGAGPPHLEERHPAGTSVEDGLPVRRFTRSSPLDASAPCWSSDPRGRAADHREQQRWMNAGVRSPGAVPPPARPRGEYRAMVFTPYPFWVAFACSQIAPARSVLWTCLHDEPYAYLELFQPVLTGSEGCCSRPPPSTSSPTASFLRPGPARGGRLRRGGAGVVRRRGVPRALRHQRPFLLYAGRREGAKGWEALLDASRTRAAPRLPFSLVTMGAGEVRPPLQIADRVVDLGFLPDAERDTAFAAPTPTSSPAATRPSPGRSWRPGWPAPR